MPWEVVHRPEHGYIDIVLRGRLDGEDIRTLTSETIALGRTAATQSFLADASEADVTADLVDLYDVPAKQYVDEGADRLGRMAIVMPPSEETRRAIAFFESVCRNRGWNVKTFADRTEALRWLAAWDADAQA